MKYLDYNKNTKLIIKKYHIYNFIRLKIIIN